MKGLLVVTVGVGVVGAILAWRERSEPGAVPLVFLLAGQTWWSATLFFRVMETGIGGKIFWVDVSWIGIAVIPVAWLLFSLEYTGHSQYLKPRYIAIASVVPFVTAVLGLLDGQHDLLYVSSTLVTREGIATLERVPGVWYWVIAGYTYLLGLLGTVPLLRFITSDVDTFRGQSFALLLGLFSPWITNALFLSGVLPTAGIDPTPIAFSLSGVAYLGALTRFELFGTSPAPIRQGRQSIFRNMKEGAIVLDRHNHIVEMNRQAVEALEVDPAEVFGRRIKDAVPEMTNELGTQGQAEQTVYHPEDGQRAYDVSVRQITDTRDRTTGHIITLHDISTHLRQQQRLEVLNRVFRHNIRNNTQVIIGNADYLATHNSEEVSAKVLENAQEIKDISQKIRVVIDLFEQQRKPVDPIQLSTLLEECVVTVRREHPDTTINSSINSEGIYVDRSLKDVFVNTIENAAQHNTEPDPQVWVEVVPGGEHVQVTVEDNGPGINENELSLIERGTETPLTHGTGFGLALIVWGTEINGGTVSFENNDPMGLTVTIEVPTVSRPEEDRSSVETESGQLSKLDGQPT